ncbi:flagellar hook-basal body complex protein FliE [Sphingobium yanoikuyae]
MGDISVNNVMAVRGAILQRNIALRNVATNPNHVGTAGVIARPSFESTMDALLQNNATPRGVGAASETARVAQASDVEQSTFVSTFQAQLRKVSELDAQEETATEAYERGETTDIAQVMLTSQRSSIAFEATLQVRNKLLSAYKDIMSMPI